MQLDSQDLSSSYFKLDPLDEKSLLEVDEILNQSVLSENNSTSKFEVTIPSKDETGDFEERSHYYLQNFMHILNTVIKSDKSLFDSDELETIKKFNDISNPAKKLYIRLYQRKVYCFQCDKIVYPGIATDLTLLFNP